MVLEKRTKLVNFIFVAILATAFIVLIYFIGKETTSTRSSDVCIETPIKTIMLVNDDVPCDYSITLTGDTLWIVLIK
jgi:hypothetical protein